MLQYQPASNIIATAVGSIADGVSGISLQKYLAVTVVAGQLLAHTAVAVLTGNISGIVNDISSLAQASMHCKSQCGRLATMAAVTGAATADLLKAFETRPAPDSLRPALEHFVGMLEVMRKTVKQHSQSKYGWKIFLGAFLFIA